MERWAGVFDAPGRSEGRNALLGSRDPGNGQKLRGSVFQQNEHNHLRSDKDTEIALPHTVSFRCERSTTASSKNHGGAGSVSGYGTICDFVPCVSQLHSVSRAPKIKVDDVEFWGEIWDRRYRSCQV